MTSEVRDQLHQIDLRGSVKYLMLWKQNSRDGM